MTALRRDLLAALSEVADPSRAPGMQAYMKSRMPFLGVPAPVLRQTCKTVFADREFRSARQWQLCVLNLWRHAEYREERYAALWLSGNRRALDYQTPFAMKMYEEMIVTGAWWDFVDEIASRRVGPILANHPKVMTRKMLSWSACDDIWKRRTAILCQLGFKERTDLDLLYACIEPSLGSREFFLQKAIGWALRQHAWIDPREIRRYVRRNESRLSALSRREALKNVGSQ